MGACVQTDPCTHSDPDISRAHRHCYKGADQAEDTFTMALTHPAL